MTAQEEAVFEKKAEQHFKSHREMPTGRDFRWDHKRSVDEETNFRKNFDTIFPNSPGYGF